MPFQEVYLWCMHAALPFPASAYRKEKISYPHISMSPWEILYQLHPVYSIYNIVDLFLPISSLPIGRKCPASW